VYVVALIAIMVCNGVLLQHGYDMRAALCIAGGAGVSAAEVVRRVVVIRHRRLGR
jgi:hypothetical protein